MAYLAKRLGSDSCSPELPRSNDIFRHHRQQKPISSSESEEDLENYLHMLRGASKVKETVKPRSSPAVIVVSDDHYTTSDSDTDSDRESDCAIIGTEANQQSSRATFLRSGKTCKRESFSHVAFDNLRSVDSNRQIVGNSKAVDKSAAGNRGDNFIYDSDEVDTVSDGDASASGESESELWRTKSVPRSRDYRKLLDHRDLSSSPGLLRSPTSSGDHNSPKTNLNVKIGSKASIEEDRVTKLLSQLRGLELSSSSDELEDFVISNAKPKKVKLKSKLKVKSQVPQTEDYKNVDSTSAFVYALSAKSADECRNEEARKYIGVSKRTFVSLRNELALILFDRFDSTIFHFGEAREHVHVEWSTRLLKTSGRCKFKATLAGRRSAYVELSTKVCDSPERIRDTLLHELCHAASWIVDGKNDGHGPIWRSWTDRVSHAYPRLPLVRRCHSYEIQFKYIYKCTRCASEVKRHSKSVDMDKQVCGRCRGKFELFINKGENGFRPAGRRAAESVDVALENVDPNRFPSPRTPPSNRAGGGGTANSDLRAYRSRLTPFAAYVKREFALTRSTMPGASHAEIMKKLGSRFKEISAAKQQQLCLQSLEL